MGEHFFVTFSYFSKEDVVNEAGAAYDDRRGGTVRKRTYVCWIGPEAQWMHEASKKEVLPIYGVIFSRKAHIIYQNDGERICSRAGKRIADRAGHSGWAAPGFGDAAV